jgi:hypothetical protein
MSCMCLNLDIIKWIYQVFQPHSLLLELFDSLSKDFTQVGSPGSVWDASVGNVVLSSVPSPFHHSFIVDLVS